MKTTILAVLVMIGMGLKGQSPNDKKNEIKVDLHGIATNQVQLGYSYYLFKDFSLQINAFTGNNIKWPDRVESRSGFSLDLKPEFHAKDKPLSLIAGPSLHYINSVHPYSIYEYVDNEDVFHKGHAVMDSFGAGFIIGPKWVSKSGWVVEATLSHRRLYHKSFSFESEEWKTRIESEHNLDEAYQKDLDFSISLGYRF